MRRRLAVIISLAILGLALGGCSKCGGSIFDQSRACNNETPR
jgi:hypothetical protein